MFCLVFLVSHRDYTDDTVMMQPAWLTITLLIIVLLVSVVIPYIKDKAKQEEEERYKLLMRNAKIFDNKRTVDKETKNKRMITNYANHCIVYKRPTNCSYLYYLLSIINGEPVIICDSRYKDVLIEYIETNNPNRVFLASQTFLDFECSYLGECNETSIFKPCTTLLYILKKTTFDDAKLDLLPYLLELDALSKEIESVYSYMPNRYNTIVEYLECIGEGKAKEVCSLIPDRHDRRIASTATSKYQLSIQRRW